MKVFQKEHQFYSHHVARTTEVEMKSVIWHMWQWRILVLGHWLCHASVHSFSPWARPVMSLNNVSNYNPPFRSTLIQHPKCVHWNKILQWDMLIAKSAYHHIYINTTFFIYFGVLRCSSVTFSLFAIILSIIWWWYTCQTWIFDENHYFLLI